MSGNIDTLQLFIISIEVVGGKGRRGVVGGKLGKYHNLKFTLATIIMVSCPLHQSSDGFIMTPTPTYSPDDY